MGIVSILGGGKMGEALVAGLLRGERPTADVLVVERYPDRARYLTDTYGVRVVDAAEAASAEVLVVVVKPQDVSGLLAEIGPGLRPHQLVLSVSAGVTVATLEAGLPAGVPVVRSMPNTPALVGQGMTAIAPGTHAGEDQLAAAEELLGAVGRVVRVSEPQLDAVTALSGSGPAYFFLLVEALIEAGVLQGLPRPLAAELVGQTALGAATMLAESGEAAGQLREAVTSPGGTTIAGLRALEDHGLRSAVFAAVDAAAARSRELGRG
jgi:pyrroline-5-carboxylate reductase